MSQSIMLDLETLDTSPTSVVLTFGAVKFNPNNLEEPTMPFYARLNVDEQTVLGRTTSEDTLEWWSKQDPEVQAEAFSDDDRVSLIDFTTELNKYTVGVNTIWAQGPTFDIVILENLYRMMGIPVPWQYWQIRDSRTLMDVGDSSFRQKNTAAHNALADAFYQAVTVQKIYNQLGIK